MNVRKLLFNVIDRKNGSPVAKGINDLSFQFDSGFTCADERKRDIVHHITDTVPYYRAYRGAELSELPVIEKRIIKGKSRALRIRCLRCQTEFIKEGDHQWFIWHSFYFLSQSRKKKPNDRRGLLFW